jgi:hypothetical protein
MSFLGGVLVIVAVFLFADALADLLDEEDE